MLASAVTLMLALAVLVLSLKLISVPAVSDISTPLANRPLLVTFNAPAVASLLNAAPAVRVLFLWLTIFAAV